METEAPKPRSIGLFDRLPKDIFRPLASENRERMWELLLHLYEAFFGPDALRPADEGFPHRTITAEIERFLLDCPDWTAEDGSPLETPLSVRSNMALQRLVSSGWLRADRPGVRDVVVMVPAVQKFLELLQQFAEEGPKLVGGKVQVIYNNLLAIRQAPAEQAAALHETAKEARALLASLSGTTIRVREVMDELNAHPSTGAFVDAFFRDYISAIYIRDYQELRTRNHPLRHRHDILSITRQLRDDPVARTAITGSYQKLFKCRSETDAAILFDKDITRLLRFQDIQLHLDRLDESISRATRQAISTINYKLRTRGAIDTTIGKILEQLTSGTFDRDREIPTPWAPRALFSAERLRVPNKPAREPVVTPIRQVQVTPEQRAYMELMREMTRARQVSREQVKRYITSHVPKTEPLLSDTLPVSSVSDLIIYRTLALAAFLTQYAPRTKQASIPLLRLTHGLKLELLEQEAGINPYLTLPRFRLTRTEAFR